uniref:Uncharacterized protein n=1 Tax=Kalanchoe fedtschenkoi TaxID=63787 RepID=A0A7N0RIJ0_KALFE
MRRQGQHYNQSGDGYEDQMRDAASQRLGPRPVGGNFQRREQGFSYEKVRDFANARDEEQWRSGRDGSSVSNPLDSYMLNEGKLLLSLFFLGWTMHQKSNLPSIKGGSGQEQFMWF